MLDEPSTISVKGGGDGGDGGTSNGKCDGGSIAVLGGGPATGGSWNGVFVSGLCSSGNLGSNRGNEVWEICWVVENADFGVFSGS